MNISVCDIGMTDLHPLAGRSFAQEFEAQASPSCIGVTLYETLDDPPDLHTIGYRGARIPEPFDTLAREARDCKGWQEARLPVVNAAPAREALGLDANLSL